MANWMLYGAGQWLSKLTDRMHDLLLKIDILVGCWAHARRKFDEALKALPAKSVKPVATEEGLKFCNQLFAIEKN